MGKGPKRLVSRLKRRTRPRRPERRPITVVVPEKSMLLLGAGFALGLLIAAEAVLGRQRR